MYEQGQQVKVHAQYTGRVEYASGNSVLVMVGNMPMWFVLEYDPNVYIDVEVVE